MQGIWAAEHVAGDNYAYVTANGRNGDRLGGNNSIIGVLGTPAHGGVMRSAYS